MSRCATRLPSPSLEGTRPRPIIPLIRFYHGQQFREIFELLASSRFGLTILIFRELAFCQSLKGSHGLIREDQPFDARFQLKTGVDNGRFRSG